MYYENTHLSNRNSSTIKYTNKINNDECYNFKKNLSFEKWINNDVNENVNYIKNVEPTNINIIHVKCNNNTYTNINTNDNTNADTNANIDTNINNDINNDADNNMDNNMGDNMVNDMDDDADDEIKNEKKIIKANMKFLNNLRINRWTYYDYKEDKTNNIELNTSNSNDTIKKIEYKI